MNDLVSVITQNGIGVVCVAFMIYFINSTLKDNNKLLDELQKTLVSIQSTISLLVSKVDELEKIKRGEKNDER